MPEHTANLEAVAAPEQIAADTDGVDLKTTGRDAPQE